VYPQSAVIANDDRTYQFIKFNESSNPVTITTLGYGDVLPAASFTQVLVAIESIFSRSHALAWECIRSLIKW
ncbi:MAG: hypothetical protein QS748_14885, partial [Candidatus Endonucleobacter bathymodioli]|nr:hypothetical protein [Candidatus Endonucleobacter bathymodioli]